jgi:hypothetical protein
MIGFYWVHTIKGCVYISEIHVDVPENNFAPVWLYLAEEQPGLMRQSLLGNTPPNRDKVLAPSVLPTELWLI